jgi:hypothetical protein
MEQQQSQEQKRVFKEDEALNDRQFLSFLSSFPAHTPDQLERIWGMYQTSETLKNIYATAISKDTGLEITPDQLNDVGSYMADTAANNPDAFESITETVNEYTSMPDRISDAISRMYKGKSKLEEQETLLHKVATPTTKPSLVKRLPVIGNLLKTEDEKIQDEERRQATLRLKEIYGVKDLSDKGIEEALEEIRARRVEMGAAKYEREQLEHVDLDLVKQRLFSQVFEPARIAREIAKTKIAETVRELKSTTGADANTAAGLKAIRDRREKYLELYRNLTNVDKKNSKYADLIESPSFDYGIGNTPGDVAQAGVETIQQNVESVVKAQVEKIIDTQSNVPRGGSIDKLESAIAKLLGKEVGPTYTGKYEIGLTPLKDSQVEIMMNILEAYDNTPADADRKEMLKQSIAKFRLIKRCELSLGDAMLKILGKENPDMIHLENHQLESVIKVLNAHDQAPAGVKRELLERVINKFKLVDIYNFNAAGQQP